jgi:hypothetical protein
LFFLLVALESARLAKKIWFSKPSGTGAQPVSGERHPAKAREASRSKSAR